MDFSRAWAFGIPEPKDVHIYPNKIPDPQNAHKRPEEFLELVERAKRGRLKVYIGSAAGVGKTYRMLEEAHALQKRGVDVVLASSSHMAGARPRR